MTAFNEKMTIRFGKTAILPAGFTVLIFLAFGPLSANAQVLSGQLINNVVSKSMANISKRKVLVTPALVVVNTKKRTADITFTNSTYETLETTVSIGKSPPAEVNFPGLQENVQRRVEKNSADTSSSGVSRDSSGADQPFARWVEGLPATLKLAPGEKKTITVKLNIPKDAKPGDYYAWIVTTTMANLNDHSGLTEDDVLSFALDKKSKSDIKVQAGAKITYKYEGTD